MVGRQLGYGTSAADEEVTGKIISNKIELGKLRNKVREKIGKEKHRRVTRENVKVKYLMTMIKKIGSIAYRKLNSNSGEELQRYEVI